MPWEAFQSELFKTFANFSKEETMFTTPPTPMETSVEVKLACAAGICDCSHILGGVVSQLRPCRFAYFIFKDLNNVSNEDQQLFVGVCDGFAVVDREPAPYSCNNYLSILSEENKPKMDSIVATELAEGFLSVSEETPTCIHALGAVPKGPQGIRPITDCSRPSGVSVNDRCSSLVKKFSYLNVHDVVKLVTPGAFLSVVDIQAAYRAVPVKPSHRKYLGLRWNLSGRDLYLTDNRLCFGMSTGPCYFNMVSCFIANTLRRDFNINVIQYLDDFCLVSAREDDAQVAQWTTVKFIRHLGFHIAWRKVASPATCVTYLGVEIDTSRMELRLPMEKVNKFKRFVSRFAKEKSISKKELEELNGVLSHCSQIVQGGRVFTRRCYDTYRQIIQLKRNRINISPGMSSDLQWWVDFAPHFNGVNLIPHMEAETPIYTDSSLVAYAAVSGCDWAMGLWGQVHFEGPSSPCGHVVSAPHLEEDHRRNINVLELWAAVVALERLSSQIANHVVTMWIDNKQVIAMLLNGASVNPKCMDWVRRLFWVLMKDNIKLNPTYIKSEENVVADTLSRIPFIKNYLEFEALITPQKLCCNDVLINMFSSRSVRPKGKGQVLSC